MENQQRQQVKKYIDLLFAHWKFITVCLLVAVSAGLVFYLRAPKLFKSEALLSYEPQQINPGSMSPEGKGRGLKSTVSTLSELVMSRNNLEMIINQVDLYPQSRQKLPIEDVIEQMRRNIRIIPSSKGDTFTVGFQGTQPEKVKKVANALAAKFIEENLKYREERATETSKYTADELNMAKSVLDKKEEIMRDYKLKYYNEMPEQRQSNLARLSSLHGQYQSLQESIQDLEKTRVLAMEQIALRKQASPIVDNDNPSSEQYLGNYARLQKLQQYLEDLRVKYTEKHPEIRRVKQLIAKLEQDIQGEGNGDRSTGQLLPSPLELEIRQIQLQVKKIDLNISELKQKQKKIQTAIERYEGWVDAAPVREAEWTSLTRDYEQLRRHYDQLVSRNLQAESVEYLEQKQKGSKFKIIDSARLPETPFKPDFIRMLLLTLGMGGGFSVGTILFIDLLNTSFKDVHDVEKILGVGVICSVPYIETKTEKRKQRMINILVTVLFSVYVLALGAAFVYLYSKGKIIF